MSISTLSPLVGEWSVTAEFPGASPEETQGTTVFEWFPGGRFLTQRWEVAHPAAPTALSFIGFDEGRQTFLQHYFDSRGVARVYTMTFDGRRWELSRTEPDFSDLSFWQRYSGELSEDGATIAGVWEMSRDEGATWNVDFPMTYRRRS